MPFGATWSFITSVSLRDAKMEYLLATRGAKASKKLKDFWF
jgi:hypothetical protein